MNNNKFKELLQQDEGGPPGLEQLKECVISHDKALLRRDGSSLTEQLRCFFPSMPVSFQFRLFSSGSSGRD